MPPDWTQIGMFWVSTVLVLITVMVAYINYRMYRLQTDPNVIVYAEPDLKRPTIINLIVENAGNGIAKDVEFNSDRPIPSRGFGLDNDAKMPENMTTGPLITGIPELGPGSKRVITWGQYHGLFKALGMDVLTITARYSANRVFLNKPNFQSEFTLDVKSYEGTDASYQNWDKIIAESLVKIATSIESIFDFVEKNQDISNK